MRNLLTEVKMKEEVIDKLEALYTEYRAKQDIINYIFDLHKFDEDDSIIKSSPFRSYEKEFTEIKVKYDEAMKMVSDEIVPKQYRDIGCTWEVDFNENLLKIYSLN